MNLSFQDADEVRALRCDLFAEHTGHDTAALAGADALRLFAATARANAQRRDAGEVNWQGIVFALDPATYAS